MLTKKRVLTGLVTATAAGILFTGAPAGAQPAPAGLTGAGVASARALQAAPATTLTYDHHRRHHRRHFRHHRRHFRHHRRHFRRHFRHHRRHFRRHYRPYRHYRHGRYMGFSRMTVANRNINVNRNRVATGVRVANQNNNIAIARNRGLRRWGG